MGVQDKHIGKGRKKVLEFSRWMNLWGPLIMLDHVRILDQSIEKIMTDLEGDLDISIYLFGSFLKKRQSNDIDLLIIFNCIAFKKVKEIKKNISYKLQDVFGIPVHFTTLSRGELIETSGMNIEKFHIVYVREN
jgi:predicted nucleotidyltransferase